MWKDERFDFVFAVSLKDMALYFNNYASIDFYEYVFDKVVQKYLGKGIKKDKAISLLRKSNEEGKLLWLFDGFDELQILCRASKKVQNVAKAITQHLEVGSNALLLNYLLTSRPNVVDSTNFTMIAEILPLRGRDMVFFINTYFENSDTKKSLAMPLVRAKRSENETLKTPLFLEMVCKLIDSEGDKLNLSALRESPQIRAEKILQLFISCCITNSIQDKERFLRSEMESLLEHLLSLLAFYSLKEKFYFISEEKMHRICELYLHSPKDFNIFDLSVKSCSSEEQFFDLPPVQVVMECIQRSHVFRKVGKHFYFAHFALQEYLSSLFISKYVMLNERMEVDEGKVLEWVKEARREWLSGTDIPKFLHFFHNLPQQKEHLSELFERDSNHKENSLLQSEKLMHQVSFLNDRHHSHSHKKFSRSMKQLQLRVVNGDTDSINQLGMLHFCGKEVEQSYTKAFKLFQQAAKRGNSDAMFAQYFFFFPPIFFIFYLCSTGTMLE